jgi:putative transcriptional regulator
MRKTTRKRRKASRTYLDGQLLIAMPNLTDSRFARSVIYMCAHSEDGAMGLIINQRAKHITFPMLLEQLKIVTKAKLAALPDKITSTMVHVGGPVETVRGFVLHSSDYFAADSTLPIDANVCLTATLDVLKAMAGGRGPQRAILALGYANWSPGQLESEIRANGWLHCAADAELVFAGDLEGKYERAMGKLGINPSHLISEAGHA